MQTVLPHRVRLRAGDNFTSAQRLEYTADGGSFKHIPWVSLSYVVQDPESGIALSCVQPIAIQVAHVNTPPVASAVTRIATDLMSSLPFLLINLDVGDIDEWASDLAVFVSQMPKAGRLATSNGASIAPGQPVEGLTLRYHPEHATAEAGTLDSFRYSASDGFAMSAEASVQVIIEQNSTIPVTPIGSRGYAARLGPSSSISLGSWLDFSSLHAQVRCAQRCFYMTAMCQLRSERFVAWPWLAQISHSGAWSATWVFMQGTIVFNLRLAPTLVMATVHIMTVGPFSLVYSHRMASIQIAFGSATAQQELLPDLNWHDVALAWTQDRPCISVDASSWSCVSDAALAAAVQQRRAHQQAANEVVLGGNGNLPGVTSLAADVDNLHLFSGAPTAPAMALHTDIAQASSLCTPRDRCGIAQGLSGAQEELIELQQSAVARFLFNDISERPATLQYGQVNATLKNITPLLSSVEMTDALCLLEGVHVLYTPPISPVAHGSISLAGNCSTTLRLTQVAPSGGLGAQLDLQNGTATLEAGGSVFVQGLPPSTSTQTCILELTLSSLVHTVAVTVQQAHRLLTAGDAAIQASASQSAVPIALPIQGLAAEDVRVNITIVSLPDSGHLESESLPGFPLQISSTVPATAPLSWHVPRHEDPSGVTFKYTVADGCGIGHVSSVSIERERRNSSIPLATVAAAGLAVCFDGESSAALHSLPSATQVDSIVISVWFQAAANSAGATIIELGAGMALSFNLGQELVFSVGSAQVHAPATFVPGTWHHAFALWDATLPGISLSIDGGPAKHVLASSLSDVPEAQANTISVLGRGFVGCLDEVAVLHLACNAAVTCSITGMAASAQQAALQAPLEASNWNNSVVFHMNEGLGSTLEASTGSQAPARGVLLAGLSNQMPEWQLSGALSRSTAHSEPDIPAGRDWQVQPVVHQAGPPPMEVVISWLFPTAANATIGLISPSGTFRHLTDSGERVSMEPTEVLVVKTDAAVASAYTVWYSATADPEAVQSHFFSTFPVSGSPFCSSGNSAGGLQLQCDSRAVSAALQASPQRKVSAMMAEPTVLDQSSSTAASTGLLSFTTGTHAVYAPVTEWITSSQLADCRRFRQLPGIQFLFRSVSPLTGGVHIAQSALWSIGITASQQVLATVGTASASVYVAAINDGAWRRLSLRVLDSQMTLTVGTTSISTQLNAQQLNDTLAVLEQGEADTVLGSWLSSSEQHSFVGDLESVRVTLEQPVYFQRDVLALESLPPLQGFSSAAAGSSGLPANVLSVVTDEDSPIQITLPSHLSSLDATSPQVVDLPTLGQLFEITGDGSQVPFDTPFTSVPTRHVAYHPPADACSPTSQPFDTFQYQDEASDGAVSPIITVEVAVNCLNDGLEAILQPADFHIAPNTVLRMPLASIVHDPDNDATFEIVTTPTHGHLFLVDSDDEVPISGPGCLPHGVTELVFKPVLNTHGSPYSKFSIAVHDGVHVLPEIEVRVFMDGSLGLLANSAAAPAVASPPAAESQAWEEATVDAWFRWDALADAQPATVACRLVHQLGLGPVCSLGGASFTEAQERSWGPASWHHAAVTAESGSTDIWIDGQHLGTFQTGAVSAPSADELASEKGAAAIGRMRVWPAQVSASTTAAALMEHGTIDLAELRADLNFNRMTNSATLDGISGATVSVLNSNRTQLHMPVPGYTTPDSLAETPLVEGYGAIGSAGHALQFTGGESIRVSARLDAAAFTFEGWFATSHAGGRAVALADLGHGIVLGWTRATGLTMATPEAGYSLPTLRNFNDGGWHYVQASVEWMPAGNLLKPELGYEGKYRLQLSVDASNVTMGYIPYQRLNDMVTIGAAEGFAGYSNLLDEVQLFAYARSTEQAAAAIEGRSLPFEGAPVTHLRFDEGLGAVTADAVTGRQLTIDSAFTADPSNAVWVPSTAPVSSGGLVLVAGETTTLLLGVDADADDIVALVTSPEHLPDPAIAFLLQPACTEAALLCQVTEADLPLQIPAASAMLHTSIDFDSAIAVPLLTYSLTDGRVTSGPYTLFAAASSGMQSPPSVTGIFSVSPLPTATQFAIAPQLVDLSDLAIDPGGAPVEYFLRFVEGAARLHQHNSTLAGSLGAPVQSGVQDAETLELPSGEVVRGWRLDTSAAVMVPMAVERSVHIWVVACSSQNACSEAILDIESSTVCL